MTPNSRLKLILIVFAITMIYAFLIAINDKIAREVMLGYCGIVLTSFVADHLSRGKE